jgi:hypothetical protein
MISKNPSIIGVNMRHNFIASLVVAGLFFVAMPTEKSYAATYTPTQSTLLSMADENPGEGATGVLNSIVPDTNGGVIVTFTFGTTGDPKSAFDNTYSPNIDLSNFTDEAVNLTLLPGSDIDNIVVLLYGQEGSPNFLFLGSPGVTVSIGGGTQELDFVFPNNLNTSEIFRSGFNVFPPNNTPPIGPASDELEIDPIPEPSSAALIGLAVAGICSLHRRRHDSDAKQT